MRSVIRSPEPARLAELRATGKPWRDLTSQDRNAIRSALRSDFGPICSYCQQLCQPARPRSQTDETPAPPDEESIEHFRPRDKFPSLIFDWLNLIYACYRCNQMKDGKWPVADDMKTLFLTRFYSPRYTPVSEYVNPNEADDLRPAQEFFDWDFETGEMMPSENLDRVDWSIARRTIFDIDLNDELSDIGPFDPNHILNQRRYLLYLFLERLIHIDDPNLRDQLIQGTRSPHQPFSEFISSYFRQVAGSQFSGTSRDNS